MHLMHEEDILGDTYIGFVHVFEGDGEGIKCDRCQAKFFEGILLIAFDNTGSSSRFDDVVVCESCLGEIGTYQNSVEWTETLSCRWHGSPSPTIVVMSAPDLEGIKCDRCKRIDAVPVLSFDTSGGLYDSLCVCRTCIEELLAIGHARMLIVAMDRLNVGCSPPTVDHIP